MSLAGIVAMNAAVGYVATRRVLLPGMRLTQQLTVNRSRFPVRPSRHAVPSLFSHAPRSTSLLHAVGTSVASLCARVAMGASLVMRLVQLGVLFGPLVAAGVPLWLLGLLSSRRLFCWTRWTLGTAGATFIKLGQWAATRPDVLPRELCSQLSMLHSQAPTHKMAWNQHVIKEAFGVSLDSLFVEFDATPVGSGTIAQVHRARLRRDSAEPSEMVEETMIASDSHRDSRMSQSSDVAVKITHPGIEVTISRDLEVLRLAAQLVDWLIPSLRWLALPEEVRVFSAMMREQVDLRFEAFNLRRFGQNFEGAAKAWGHRPRIRFPQPHFPLVTRRCLVEDLVTDALPIAFLCDFAATGGASLRELATVRRDAAVLGLRSFLQMLLWDNFVHADLHPGNILVTFVERERREGRGGGMIAEVMANLVRRVVTLADSCRRLAVRMVTPGPLPLSSPRGRCTRRHGEDDRVFLQRQLARGAEVQLVLLDTGLVTELSRRDFANFTDLFQMLVVRGDGHAAGQLMINRSPVAAQRLVVDRAGFCRELGELVRPFFGGGVPAGASARIIAGDASLQTLRLDVVLQRVFDLARKHRVRIDAAFTNLVMSLLCVEGLGRQLAPEMNLRPLLAQAALQYLVTAVARTAGGEQDA